MTTTTDVAFRGAPDVGDTHPDVEALLGLLLTPGRPAAIDVERPVSGTFAGAAARHGIAVGHTDPTLLPRPRGTRTGLCLSGGVDSIAAAWVSGGDLVASHLLPLPHPSGRDAAPHRDLGPQLRASLAAGAALGAEVDVVESDLFYLRGDVPSFPTWPAVAAGLLLHADVRDLGSVVLGSVLGARHLTDGAAFRPTPAAPWWFDLFEAAGLPLCQPVAAVTEVVTQHVVERLGLADVSRSCLRGPPESECGRCPKCLRKTVIRAGLAGRQVPRADALADDPLLGRYFQREPVPMSHTWTWARDAVPELSTGPLAGFVHRAARAGVRADWVRRAYLPALEPLPADMAARAEARLADAGVAAMTDTDTAALQAW